MREGELKTGTPHHPPSPLETILAPRLSPDEARRTAMLDQVLARMRHAMNAPSQRLAWRLRGWLADYPWRLAFVLSTLQTAVCMAVFGDAYLRLVLQMFLPFHGAGR